MYNIGIAGKLRQKRKNRKQGIMWLYMKLNCQGDI